MQYSVRVICADERNKEVRARVVMVIILSDIRRGAPWPSLVFYHTEAVSLGFIALVSSD